MQNWPFVRFIRHLDWIKKTNIFMKQYQIDGLRLDDFHKLQAYLDRYLEKATVNGIYWLTIDSSKLTSLQKKHIACGPHVFALMLEETCLSCEFLVRNKKNIHCDCMAYATEDQRNWLINIIDEILETLNIHI